MNPSVKTFKIRDLQGSVKDLFDEKKPLPAAIALFPAVSYGLGTTVCLILALGLTAGSAPLLFSPETFNEGLRNVLIGIPPAVLLTAWRIFLHARYTAKARNRTWRYGLFLTSKELIVRDVGKKFCRIIARNEIEDFYYTTHQRYHRTIWAQLGPEKNRRNDYAISLPVIWSVAVLDLWFYLRLWKTGLPDLPSGFITRLDGMKEVKEKLLKEKG